MCIPFSHRHGKSTADYITEHVVDNHICMKCPQPFKYLEGGNDPPSCTAYPRFRATCLDAADTPVPGKNHILLRDCLVAPFPDLIHHGGDQPAVHQHAGAVTFRIASNLEDIEPHHGKGC